MRPNALMTSTLALALASCGGSDGGTTPTGPNRPPVFTSLAAVTIPENTATVYNATATDADNDPITFTISGGADAALFSITATGGLSFKVPPDFENPADADGNNVYQIQLTAADGRGGTVTQDFAVTITNAGPDAFRVRRVSASFNQPLAAVARPGTTATNRMYIVEKGGLIRILDTSTGAIAATPFLNVSSEISTSGERGLLGMAFSPSYATDRTFYVFLTNTTGTIEIRKYTTTAANLDAADPTSADVILTVPHPGADNHNGGFIAFGPDGNLYLGIGDGGGAGDPSGNAQNTNSLLGKILRVSVGTDSFPNDPLRDYAIPVGNPYATTGGAPEVWALGLRNPYRASFDVTGALFIADVGQDAIEEINIAPPGSNGLNFGWNLREGSQAYNGGANDTAKFTAPVAEYGHGNGPLQGNSITGGVVYRGPVEALQGQYFFGDFVSSNIWSLPLFRFAQAMSQTPPQTLASSVFTQRRTAFTPDVGTINSISAFGADEKGNLYIVDFGGEVFVVEPTP